MTSSGRSRRIVRFWLPASAVLFMGAGMVVLFGYRTFSSWLTLVSTFATFMGFVQLKRAGAA